LELLDPNLELIASLVFFFFFIRPIFVEKKNYIFAKLKGDLKKRFLVIRSAKKKNFKLKIPQIHIFGFHCAKVKTKTIER
jgi:hypothetical protein